MFLYYWKLCTYWNIKAVIFYVSKSVESEKYAYAHLHSSDTLNFNKELLSRDIFYVWVNYPWIVFSCLVNFHWRKSWFQLNFLLIIGSVKTVFPFLSWNNMIDWLKQTKKYLTILRIFEWKIMWWISCEVITF